MTNYHAYLIRIWRDNEQVPWRATLIMPKTGKQYSFSSFEQAMVFLEERLHQTDSIDKPLPDVGCGHSHPTMEN
jgi:hypothetical protein